MPKDNQFYKNLSVSKALTVISYVKEKLTDITSIISKSITNTKPVSINMISAIKAAKFSCDPESGFISMMLTTKYLTSYVSEDIKNITSKFSDREREAMSKIQLSCTDINEKVSKVIADNNTLFKSINKTIKALDNMNQSMIDATESNRDLSKTMIETDKVILEAMKVVKDVIDVSSQ